MTTARQAAAQRKKLLAEHARLMERERKIREAYGPLALRWAREFSGLIAFPVAKSVIVPGIEDQLDGILGRDQWSIDERRWSNAASIIVPKTNPRHAMTRMLMDRYKPTKMNNEIAHVARKRLGGRVGFPRFPWETEEDARMHWIAYEHYRRTDLRTKVVESL